MMELFAREMLRRRLAAQFQVDPGRIAITERASIGVEVTFDGQPAPEEWRPLIDEIQSEHDERQMRALVRDVVARELDLSEDGIEDNESKFVGSLCDIAIAAIREDRRQREPVDLQVAVAHAVQKERAACADAVEGLRATVYDKASSGAVTVNVADVIRARTDPREPQFCGGCGKVHVLGGHPPWPPSDRRDVGRQVEDA